ncbi:10680_t:CDS:2 [Racocetra fulgida]|uniref:10680_t:CDS:1 n=1 Tax=Racocetra fulgida TaxID=60492 RepID=A0A9N9EYS3_9GLOM|nr:10680_t:CDS:2 [Racocetra fulgida]
MTAFTLVKNSILKCIVDVAYISSFRYFMLPYFSSTTILLS